MPDKQDSNATGLSIAEEASFKTLPGTPDWYPRQPNSYGDFGANNSLVARVPINSSRQRQKGVVVDVDAAGNWEEDITQFNLDRIMQGFMFASAREKPDTQPLNGAAIAITNVDGTGEDYEAAAGLDAFLAQHLVYASGFTNAANNGLKSVASAGAASLTVDQDLVDETPPAGHRIVAVGVQGLAGEFDIDASGALPRLTSAGFDFETLDLVPGEMIYIGGDGAGLGFANAVNNGWARIKTIEPDALTLDKTQFTMVTEASTTETVQIFFGKVLKNELAANIVRRTYQLERTLGNDGSGTQAEYVIGAVPNTLSLNLRNAGIATASFGFLGASAETVDGATGVKSGNRPTPNPGNAYNGTSHVKLLKMHVIDPASGNPTALFARVLELTLSIGNNIDPNKAIGVLGAFDASAGDFQVGGQARAYFADVAAVAAVQANADVTIHGALVRDNSGMAFDIPLIALGDARSQIERNRAIFLPLQIEAGEDQTFNHTLLFSFFNYLPDAAE